MGKRVPSFDSWVGSLNLLVFEIDIETCLGVVEVVTTSQKVNLRDELENICKALEFVLRKSEAESRYIGMTIDKQDSSLGGYPTNMEPGFVKARQFIQERIYEFLMQRQKTQEIAPNKVMDIVRRLEEGLFKTATTKEEYMNLDTLEIRLHILIRRIPLSNQNQ
ncbi:unnamed protein product [Lactuca saligna]|uniref:Uncharacterized protein n=1 Tax=Lactuca saligna TaxID=75948 RepID=A0AA35Z842_LACSI|nr:unnamed protein product [Lactuca saligna]